MAPVNRSLQITAPSEAAWRGRRGLGRNVIRALLVIGLVLAELLLRHRAVLRGVASAAIDVARAWRRAA